MLDYKGKREYRLLFIYPLLRSTSHSHPSFLHNTHKVRKNEVTSFSERHYYRWPQYLLPVCLVTEEHKNNTSFYVLPLLFTIAITDLILPNLLSSLPSFMLELGGERFSPPRLAFRGTLRVVRKIVFLTHSARRGTWTQHRRKRMTAWSVCLRVIWMYV